MLLPAIQTARNTARNALCLNNQKQIYLAIDTYASENDDAVVPSSANSVGGYVAYLGMTGTLGPLKSYRGYNVTYATTLATYQPLICPTDVAPAVMGTGSDFIGRGAIAGISYRRFEWIYLQTSYDINWSVSRYKYGKTRRAWSSGPIRTANFYTARGTEDGDLMIDGNSYEIYYLDEVDVYGPSHSYYERNVNAFHHPGSKNNTLFWDGHADGQKPFWMSGKRIWHDLFYNIDP